MKICIVLANYYPEISKNLLNGALRVFKKNKITKYRKILVPGIFEIPFVISKNINKFDAFLALGCVIKGQTPHFTFISYATTNGIMNLSIKYKKPVGNGIITCLSKRQAMKRSGRNTKNKGREAANAVLMILDNKNAPK